MDHELRRINKTPRKKQTTTTKPLVPHIGKIQFIFAPLFIVLRIFLSVSMCKA